MELLKMEKDGKKVASVRQRFLATFVDLFVVISFYLIINDKLVFVESLIARSILFFIIFEIYFVLNNYYLNGLTIGRAIANTRLYRMDGYKLTISDLLYRYIFCIIVYILSLGVLFIASYMSIKKNGRAVHDEMNKTIVLQISN